MATKRQLNKIHKLNAALRVLKEMRVTPVELYAYQLMTEIAVQYRVMSKANNGVAEEADMDSAEAFLSEFDMVGEVGQTMGELSESTGLLQGK